MATRRIVANEKLPQRCNDGLHGNLVWYGKQGALEKTPFDAEKAARDHAQAAFLARQQDDDIVAVEVRKDDGTVVFSKAGGS